MNWLTLILGIAAVGYGVARWTRLPVIPLLLIAGMGLSLAGLSPRGDISFNVVELGLSFLVFTAGIELNPDRFKNQLKAVLWTGLVQFIVAGSCGFGLARLLGFDVTSAMYLGIALCTSSTLVVVNHLKRGHQLFEPYGRLVIGVLLIQDLLMILIIVVLANLPSGVAGVTSGLAGLLLLTAVAVGCHRWLAPWAMERLKNDEETLLLVLLALLFLMMGVSFTMGMPPVVGAFLAGFSLSRFPVNGVVRGLLNSLSDFFQAAFFTALGALVIWPDWMFLGKALLLALLVLVITPPLVTLVAEATGLTSRAAVESGMLLAQTSEFALVLAVTGSRVLNQISEDILAVIALFTVLTMSLTPFLANERVTDLLLHWHPIRRRMRGRGTHKNHVLMLGFGAGGMWVIKPLLRQGHDVLVVDDDQVVIHQLKKSGIPCLRGDGADRKVLAQANAKDAMLILSGMRRVSEADPVLELAPKVPVVVRVFEQFEADHVKRRGGIPILNSEAAANTFMDWFEKTHGSR